jgi:hypothetical protein
MKGSGHQSHHKDQRRRSLAAENLIIRADRPAFFSRQKPASEIFGRNSHCFSVGYKGWCSFFFRKSLVDVAFRITFAPAFQDPVSRQSAPAV